MYTKLSHNDFDYKRILSDFVQIKDSNNFWGLYKKSLKKILIEPSFRNQVIDSPEIFYLDKKNNSNSNVREYVIIATFKGWYNKGLLDIATGKILIECKYSSIIIDDNGLAICTSNTTMYVYNIFTKNGMCCNKYKNGIVYSDNCIMSIGFEVIRTFDKLYVYDNFSLFENDGKFGIIDEFGAICFIPQEHPIIGVTDDYVVLVKDHKEIGAVDYNGEIVFPFVSPNDLTDEELKCFRISTKYGSAKFQLLPTGNAIIRFRSDWCYKMYNNQNEIVGDEPFFEEYKIIGSLIVVKENKYSDEIILDMHGRYLYDEYNCPIYCIDNKGKYLIVKGSHGKGIINDKGLKLIPCKYKKLTIDGNFTVSGKYVLDPFFTYYHKEDRYEAKTIDVQMTLNYEHVIKFSCGNRLYIKGYDAACEIGNVGIRVYNGKKEGLIGYNKEVILPAIFDSISNVEKVLFVTLNGKTGLYDPNGSFITKLEYASIEYICDNRYAVSYEKTFADSEFSKMDGFSYWGMIDLQGNIVLPIKYEGIICLTGYDNSVKPLFSIRESGMEMLCDYEGNTISNNKFQHINSFQDGMAAVKVGNRWGYIDLTGSIVIPPRYNRAKPFENGKASVESNGKTYILDKSGTCLMAFDYIEDKFNSEENESISNDGCTGSWEELGREEMDYMLENGGDWMLD